MKKSKVEKTRCSGEWTEARYNSFIMSGIRSLTRKWKPAFDVLKEAQVGRQINKSTGKLAMHYRCVACGEAFPQKEVSVDHIEPIKPVDRIISWDETISRALVEKPGFQVLCKMCHKTKTDTENAERREFKKRGFNAD